MRGRCSLQRGGGGCVASAWGSPAEQPSFKMFLAMPPCWTTLARHQPSLFPEYLEICADCVVLSADELSETFNLILC
jgi:hypothetical protein